MNKHLKCVLKLPGALILLALIPLFFLIAIASVGLMVLMLPFTLAGCFEWKVLPIEWWIDSILDVFEGYKNL